MLFTNFMKAKVQLNIKNRSMRLTVVLLAKVHIPDHFENFKTGISKWSFKHVAVDLRKLMIPNFYYNLITTSRKLNSSLKSHALLGKMFQEITCEDK